MDKIKFNALEATIADVHSAMSKGELTAKALVEYYINRINAYDKTGPAINSVIKLNPKAIEVADALDNKFKEKGFVGPLHGIPILLKDNVNTEDLETTAGSLSLEGVIPDTDAFITKKLLEAGAIILAKVNLHEFAVWGETASSILGQTLNPYDLTRTPGGSSGGTGAGIAANFGMVGIGTDTINSLRSPGSANCVIGFRPTLGLVSRDGIVPYSLTQDTAGPITRTIEDAVKVLEVISGYDPTDSSTAWSIGRRPESFIKHLKKDGLVGKRIGVLRSFFGKEEIHKEVNEAVDNSLKALENNGAILVDISEDINSDKLVKEVSLHLYELKRDLDSYLQKLEDRSQVHSLEEIITSGKYHEGIEENIKTASGLSTTTPEYYQRLAKRNDLRNEIVELFARYNIDAMVYPHQKRPVVKVGEAQVERNGVIGSVTGFPAASVPAGFTSPTEAAPIGVPVGIEFLAREWDEATLIEILYGFEQATKFRKPPVSVPELE